jgi:hypothetical protein
MGDNDKLGNKLGDSSMLQGCCMHTVLMAKLYIY